MSYRRTLADELQFEGISVRGLLDVYRLESLILDPNFGSDEGDIPDVHESLRAFGFDPGDNRVCINRKLY